MDIPVSVIDAVNGLPDAAFLVGNDGVIVAANTVAAKMFGYTHTQLIGSQVDDLMPESSREYHRQVRLGAVEAPRQRSFTSGVTFECERRNGELFQADINLSPTEIDGVLFTWAIVRDIDSPDQANAGRRQAMVALDAIGRMAATTFNLENDFAAVAERLNEVVPHDRIAVMLIDEDDPSQVEVFAVAGEPHPDYPVGTKVAVSDSAITWVTKSRGPVSFTSDRVEYAPTLAQLILRDGYTETFGVPLFDGDSIIGLVMAATKNPRRYSEFHKSLLVRMGGHLAVAVANQRMRIRVETQLKEIELVGSIGKMVSSSSDLSLAFASAEKSIRQFVHFDRLAIADIDQETNSVVGRVELGEKIPGFYENKRLFGTGEFASLDGLFLSGEPVQIDHQQIVNAAEVHEVLTALNNLGYKRLLYVPLIVADINIGLMTFGSKSESAYTNAEIAIAVRIGEHVAGSVANSLMLEQTKNDAEVESVLTEIGSVVGSSLDLQSTETQLGPLLRKLVDANSILIGGITEDQQYLRMFYADYVDAEPEPGLVPDTNLISLFPIKGTTTETVLRTLKPIVVNMESGTDFAKEYSGAGSSHAASNLKSIINVPLLANDQVFGFLGFRSSRPEGYTQRDLELAEKIALQLASSVAFTELRRRDALLADERTALISIGHTMGSALDLTDVWEDFVKEISTLLKFAHVGLAAVDHASQTLQILHDSLWPELKSVKYKKGEVFQLDGTVTGELVERGEGLLHSSISSEDWKQLYPNSSPSIAGSSIRAMIAAPLIWGDEVVAGLFVHSVEAGAYDEGALQLIERVAAQIAGPIAGSIVRQRDLELADEHSLRVAAEMETAVLAELSETKSNFIGAMSHELKTPLTSIVAFADILSRSNEKGLDGRPLQQVKVIQRNARHLEGMINELLDLSRMESGRFEIMKSPFDFVAIVAEAIESSQPQLEAMSQTVDFQISVDVLLVNGDRERLFQVITNLLSNASKYSPTDTDIEIDVREDQRWLIVEVRDRGPGVPDDDPEALFAMFGRADNEITRRVPGTGIGLHVSKRIIDEHGGQISIKSRDGGGAVARFRVPLGVNAIG